jgi:Domain of unknown function (DUF4440)
MGQPPTEDLHAQLWQLYADWFAGIPGDDDSFFRRVLADDWHYTNYYGEVRGKEDYLSYIAPIQADAPVMQMRELVVRPYPPVVIVYGMYAVPPELAPSAGGDTRFTAVWIQRDGQWTALAHHATTVVTQT